MARRRWRRGQRWFGVLVCGWRYGLDALRGVGSRSFVVLIHLVDHCKVNGMSFFLISSASSRAKPAHCKLKMEKSGESITQAPGFSSCSSGIAWCDLHSFQIVQVIVRKIAQVID